MKSIGLVEMPNLTDAVEALDCMLKTADVNFVTWEKKLGGRLVTIIIEGDVASVKEAVSAAKNAGVGKIAASAVIANPHPEIMKMVRLSSKKFNPVKES